jgi:hypothetical protein
MSHSMVCILTSFLTLFQLADMNLETYLRNRSSTSFNRNDFDCLSNKFLSRLTIRAN